MNNLKKFSEKHLTVEVFEKKERIYVVWKGKSIDREPTKFLSPVLSEILEMANNGGKRVILDFSELSYMNSSTITPIIKILERAKKGVTKISIFYQKAINWQELNFSALEIFETTNNRIEIIGL